MTRLLLIIFMSLSLIAPLAAQEQPRKINFLSVLTDQDGKPMIWNECAKFDSEAAPTKCLSIVKHDWTLGVLAMNALAVQDRNESGEDQVHRVMLAQSIYKNTAAVLDSKDIDLLCSAIAKYVNSQNYTAYLTYRAWGILDPARIKK